MAFLESPRFPVDIRYGSTGGPMFSTDVITSGNAVEFRNANWSLPRYRYNAKYSIRYRSDFIEIYEFFLVQKGRFAGFRVKDFYDYTSAANGVDTATETDITLASGGHALTTSSTFQLFKPYTQGANTINRDIVKPVSGTVLLKWGTSKTEGVDFTVDYTTGIVTLLADPAGTAITGGFQFDVPCRFDTDDLGDLYFELLNGSGTNNDVISYPDIPLIEIR